LAAAGRYPAIAKALGRRAFSFWITGGRSGNGFADHRHCRAFDDTYGHLYGPNRIYIRQGGRQVDLEQTNPISSAGPCPSGHKYRSIVFQHPAPASSERNASQAVIKEHNLDSNKEFQSAKSEASISPWRWS